MVSARHIHLSDAHMRRLFGETHEMRAVAFLAGLPEEIALKAGFASSDKITLIGPKMGRQISGVRVLGPCRGDTQVELARTDMLHLGIRGPVRISGDTKGTSPCLLVGPKGSLQLKEGVIRAWRHVHMFPQHAALFGVKDGDLMAVRVESPKCSVRFEDVMVRLIHMPVDARRLVASKGIRLGVEVHLDTDEGNACEIRSATCFELYKHDLDTGKWVLVLSDYPRREQ